MKASIASIYLSLPYVSEQLYLTKVHAKASKYSWDRINQWNVCNGLYSMVCLALIFNNTDNGTLVLYVHVYEVFERCLLPESLKKNLDCFILRGTRYSARTQELILNTLIWWNVNTMNHNCIYQCPNFPLIAFLITYSLKLK